jgi:hypothetical protein
MSDERFTPPPDDPFADDPAAHERERRRLQREAKRRERAGRASLAERVSGALDGAAAKGKEAIEQGKERVAKPPEPPPGAPEPPPLRRTAPPAKPAAPAPAAGETGETAAPQPPRTVIHHETDEFGEAAPVTVRRNPAAPPPPGTGEGPAVPAGVGATPPPRRTVSNAAIWRRRLMALGLVVLIAVAGYAAVTQLKADDPEPVPKGPATLKTISVTIPEGYTEEEMAGVAKDAGLEGSYEDATKKAAKKFDFKKAGAPSGTDTLEGFLFPATYELEKGAPADALVGEQLNAFDSNFAEVDMSYAKKKNLTTYDVVTIASMIEREVQVPEERPLVAAVIYNRLADGETLGIDATLRYEVGFDKPLTESELQMDSPYNTRLVQGLPPTPIGNPGLDSLKAAAKPADVDYKYYVFKPGTCGEHSFTADYDEFLQLSDEYQAALEAEGGQPDDC